MRRQPEFTSMLVATGVVGGLLCLAGILTGIARTHSDKRPRVCAPGDLNPSGINRCYAYPHTFQGTVIALGFATLGAILAAVFVVGFATVYRLKQAAAEVDLPGRD